jgi:hypothetical protein
MVALTAAYQPVQLIGITAHPKDPFLFDFIIRRGDSVLEGENLRRESVRLIKYFLTALTVPEKDFWVNLSPYESDRLIPEALGRTEAGRDLLVQDYYLKQLSASLSYPESALGHDFWKRVYEEARSRFAEADIPVNTFHKVWVTAGKARVLERGSSALILDSDLKVMLEEDYLSLQNNISTVRGSSLGRVKDVNHASSGVVRELMVPELEKEVNSGKTFAELRQVYNAVILAEWFKRRLRQSVIGQVYAGQNRTGGLRIDDPQAARKIYEQYLESFRKGVYNYIREETDPATGEAVPHKYFSGGVDIASQVHRTAQVIGPGELTASDRRYLSGLNRADDSMSVSVRMDPAQASVTVTDVTEIRILVQSEVPDKYWDYYDVANLPLYAHEEGPTLYHHLQRYLDVVRRTDDFTDIPVEWREYIASRQKDYERFALVHDLGKGQMQLDAKGQAPDYADHEKISAELAAADQRLTAGVTDREVFLEAVRLHGRINEVAKMPEQARGQAVAQLMDEIKSGVDRRELVQFLIGAAFLDMSASVRNGRGDVARAKDFIAAYQQYEADTRSDSAMMTEAQFRQEYSRLYGTEFLAELTAIGVDTDAKISLAQASAAIRVMRSLIAVYGRQFGEDWDAQRQDEFLAERLLRREDPLGSLYFNLMHSGPTVAPDDSLIIDDSTPIEALRPLLGHWRVNVLLTRYQNVGELRRSNWVDIQLMLHQFPVLMANYDYDDLFPPHLKIHHAAFQADLYFRLNKVVDIAPSRIISPRDPVDILNIIYGHNDGNGYYPGFTYLIDQLERAGIATIAGLRELIAAPSRQDSIRGISERDLRMLQYFMDVNDEIVRQRVPVLDEGQEFRTAEDFMAYLRGRDATGVFGRVILEPGTNLIITHGDGHREVFIFQQFDDPAAPEALIGHYSHRTNEQLWEGASDSIRLSDIQTVKIGWESIPAKRVEAATEPAADVPAVLEMTGLSPHGQAIAGILGIDPVKNLKTSQANAKVQHGITAVAGRPFDGMAQQIIAWWDEQLQKITHGKIRLNVDFVHASIWGAIFRSQDEPITPEAVAESVYERIVRDILPKTDPFDMVFKDVFLSSDGLGNIVLRAEVIGGNISEIKRQMAEAGAPLKYSAPKGDGPVYAFITLGHISALVLEELTEQEARDFLAWIKPTVRVTEAAVVHYSQRELRVAHSVTAVPFLHSDPVPAALDAAQAPGGVDLDGAKLDLQVEGPGRGFTAELSREDLRRFGDIPGFVPVVLNITPVKNLAILDGLAL